MAFETVHTMTDWYDGPRRGVATVNGRPHLYESCWSNIDSDDDDLFLLTLISDELFASAVEDWAIWKRWEHAYKTGGTTIQTHPALLEDRERHGVLAMILKKQLVVDESVRIAATAVFRYIADKEPRMEAEWKIKDYDHSKDKREKYRWPNGDDVPNIQNSQSRPPR